MRTILQCDPVGECMGFAGDCGDLQAQFAGVQGPYTYGTPPEEHTYLDDYVCTAFPDDAYITDQLLVGLISVAVALPIDLLLARAFEIANEMDGAPECWLDAPPGKWRLLLGKDAHASWHLTRDAADGGGQRVSDFVLWLVRYGSYETTLASLLRLAAWLRRRCGGKAAAKEEEEEVDGKPSGGGASDAGSSDARADAMMKRFYAASGLLGVYACWTIFAWCVGLLLHAAACCPLRMHAAC
jgi:hypothetical protein